jgi:DNA mismatch repair protein PMS2
MRKPQISVRLIVDSWRSPRNNGILILAIPWLFALIDVRIKNNGLDTVEVIDNGSGISPEDWPSIALKHHTSKLLVPSLPPTPTKTSAPTSPQRKQVPDLTTVSTFGFRGEALSALCTLCEKVEVITCTKEMKGLGKILEFDREGRLLDPHGKGVARQVRSPLVIRYVLILTYRTLPYCFMQRGTTVILHNLFKPLPVRRKEFERNAKKEFAKLLTTMMGYGLVPCAGGWDGEPLETEGGVKRGVRLTVDAVNKAG